MILFFHVCVYRAGLRHRPTKPWSRPRGFRGPALSRLKKLWCIFAHNHSITGIKWRSGILPYNWVVHHRKLVSRYDFKMWLNSGNLSQFFPLSSGHSTYAVCVIYVYFSIVVASVILLLYCISSTSYSRKIIRSESILVSGAGMISWMGEVKFG